MADPSRLASALEYLSGLDAAVAPKLRAVSDAIDPVNVARRAGLNLPMAQQAAEAAHFVGPGADIEGMVNDAREGNAAFGRGDMLGALGGYGSAAMAIPMMALPGSVKDVKAGVKALSGRSSKMADFLGDETQLFHGTHSYDGQPIERLLPASQLPDVASNQDFISLAMKPDLANKYTSENFPGATIYPVMAKLGRTFDFKDTQHLADLKAVLPAFLNSPDGARRLTKAEALNFAKQGDWRLAHYYPEYTDAIKGLGFDSFSELAEMGRESTRAVGIFDPDRVRPKFIKEPE